MSTIAVRHHHNLSHEEARSRVDAFEVKMSQYGIKLNWNAGGTHANIKNMFVKGHAELGTGYVFIELKLGMLARSQVNPEQLEGAIRRRLSAAFADAESDGESAEGSDGESAEGSDEP
jgi:putative polyhydroxyalkanoate system protein